MTTRAQQVPFDQNAKKYSCCCGNVHIKQGARIVSCLLALSVAISVIFSLTRTATVAFNSLFSAAFGIVIFGMLLYGVYKEKRLFILPYMIFQVVSLALSFIVLFVLLIMIAVNSKAVTQLAQDYYALDEIGVTPEEFNKGFNAAQHPPNYDGFLG